MSYDSSLRILVVDDEADLRELFKGTLEILGYEVITCSNAEDAIRFTYKLHPSLLFTDVVMPGLSGFELCRFLKNDRRTKDIYVGIVSALSREIDYEMSLEVGADDYITKPVKLQNIKQGLKNTISPYMKVEKWAIRPN